MCRRLFWLNGLGCYEYKTRFAPKKETLVPFDRCAFWGNKCVDLGDGRAGDLRKKPQHAITALKNKK
jgi:hypothetical protein